MANGDRLADPELLHRRFDPTDRDHWSVDASGKPARLRSGAFRFDDYPDSAPEFKGCSVFRQATLDELGLTGGDCLPNPSWALASVLVEDVRRLNRPTVPDLPNPFDAVEDAYPAGVEESEPRDAAHALITHDAGLAAADKWYRALALKFARLNLA